MPTIVTITSNPASTVSLKPALKTFASVGIKPSSNIALGDITNVNVAGAQDNEYLVYNSANNNYIVAPIHIDANTVIDSVNGGQF